MKEPKIPNIGAVFYNHGMKQYVVVTKNKGGQIHYRGKDVTGHMHVELFSQKHSPEKASSVQGDVRIFLNGCLDCGAIQDGLIGDYK